MLTNIKYRFTTESDNLKSLLEKDFYRTGHRVRDYPELAGGRLKAQSFLKRLTQVFKKDAYNA